MSGRRTIDRRLAWDGCHNVRDLGGFRTADGQETLWGAAVRSAYPDHLTVDGWAALRAHGIRTIIDLRNDNERPTDAYRRPEGLITMPLPLEDNHADAAFWQVWGQRIATPLYYRAFLERLPAQAVAVVRAVAYAEPGGVLFHCGLGRDRTGLVALLLLALAGVAAEDIADDYEMSAEHAHLIYAQKGLPPDDDRLKEIYTQENTTARAAVLATLEGLDIDAYFLTAGLDRDDLVAVRQRLVGPEPRR